MLNSTARGYNRLQQTAIGCNRLQQTAAGFFRLLQAVAYSVVNVIERLSRPASGYFRLLRPSKCHRPIDAGCCMGVGRYVKAERGEQKCSKAEKPRGERLS